MNNVDFQKYKRFSHALTVRGKLIEIPLRKGEKDAAFIDGITFTINKKDIEHLCKTFCTDDAQYIENYSRLLIDVLGFGVYQKRPGKGRYFYQSYYTLGTEEAQYGTVHIGGQRDTVLVELTGTGCQAALEGWEKRLYDFLKPLSRAHITRVDCAHDFFNGEYTPQQAAEDHTNGLFTRHNARPKSECRGTAWREEDYTGRTFYVGTRYSSRLCRVYEKGRQLGCPESPWVRFEVEFRKNDSVIPLEVLLAPGEFLTGAYPVCENLFETPARRIDYAAKKLQHGFENKLAHAKKQVGRIVNFMRDIAGWDDERIVRELKAEAELYPRGLAPDEYQCPQGYPYLVPEQGSEQPYPGFVSTGDHDQDLQNIQMHQLCELDKHHRIFLESLKNPTEQQQQDSISFTKNLQELMEMIQAKNAAKEQKRIDEYIDYMWIRYGNQFINQRQGNNHVEL